MDIKELSEMNDRIQAIKKSVLELQDLGQEIRTVMRNCEKIMSCVKMLEFQISDLIPLAEDDMGKSL